MIARSDETDLLVPLADILNATPPWRLFLKRLRARMQAGSAALFSVGDGRVAAVDAAVAPGADARALDPLAADPRLLQRLRPGRVYALAELRDSWPAMPGDLRAMRFISPAGAGMAILVARGGAEFGAADSLLLAGLAPFLSAALTNIVLLRRADDRSHLADRALAAAGVGWLALDRDGTVLAVSAGAEETLRTRTGIRCTPGQPLPGLPAAVATALAAPQIVALHDEPPVPALILPTDDGAGTLLALLRTAPAGTIDAALVAAEFALQHGEARVAAALADGAGIAAAAAALSLTTETARYYTKQAYQKMAVPGQAGLVRAVLGGVAPLARQS